MGPDQKDALDTATSRPVPQEGSLPQLTAMFGLGAGIAGLVMAPIVVFTIEGQCQFTIGNFVPICFELPVMFSAFSALLIFINLRDASRQRRVLMNRPWLALALGTIPIVLYFCFDIYFWQAAGIMHLIPAFVGVSSTTALGQFLSRPV